LRRTGTISGRAGRYLAVGKTISSLRSDSDRAAFLIIETAEDNPDNIDDLPDDEAAAGCKLEDAGDDFAGVDTVYPAKAAEKEKAEEEEDESGAGGAFFAVIAGRHGELTGLSSEVDARAR
jgi:hypothetical protein